MAKQESKQEIADQNSRWGDDPKAVDRFEVHGTEVRDGKKFVMIGDEYFEIENSPAPFLSKDKNAKTD